MHRSTPSKGIHIASRSEVQRQGTGAGKVSGSVVLNVASAYPSHTPIGGNMGGGSMQANVLRSLSSFMAVCRRKPALAVVTCILCGTCLYMLVAAPRAPSVETSHIVSRDLSPATLAAPALAHALTGGEEFTVLINTFKRPDRLRRATAHYRTCAGVAEVRVVWSEVDVTPPDDVDADDKHAAVRYDRHEINLLSNRYREPPNGAGFRTEAIFSVDDDVYVNCGSLLYAFHVWRHARNSMVGFYPRWHERLSDGTYAYRHWHTVFSQGILYSIVLTKAAFHSASTMALYWDDVHTPPELREMVDKQKNCEDILISIAHANATREPPIWVYGSLEDTGWYDGISTSHSSSMIPQGHAPKRHDCLTTFSRAYGAAASSSGEHDVGPLPLVASATYASPTRGRVSSTLGIPVPTYTGQPPTMLEYFAPR